MERYEYDLGHGCESVSGSSTIVVTLRLGRNCGEGNSCGPMLLSTRRCEIEPNDSIRPEESEETDDFPENTDEDRDPTESWARARATARDIPEAEPEAEPDAEPDAEPEAEPEEDVDAEW